jgi:hypothetical protein
VGPAAKRDSELPDSTLSAEPLTLPTTAGSGQEVVGLFARMSTFQGSADDLDRMSKEAEAAIPVQLPGEKGVLIIGDRQSGKSIAITFWEDEQALRESEEAANKLRSDIAEGAGSQIVSVERFEVLIDQRRS